MTTTPIDTTMAVQSAMQDDPVRRKQAIDALQRRIGDSRTEDEKLREACEGFETIFLQQIWEQMRKGVPKEGYLHSKDEEAYQSMFDHELARKMTSAGGIGLADMLHEQLSRTLHDASRGAVSGGLREPIPLATPRETLAASVARTQALEDLYSPVDDSAPASVAEASGDDILRQALDDLRQENDTANAPEVLAAMTGPRVSAQPHFVPPGAEPRIVANASGPVVSTPISTIGSYVAAPGKDVPSRTRFGGAPVVPSSEASVMPSADTYEIPPEVTAAVRASVSTTL